MNEALQLRVRSKMPVQSIVCNNINKLRRWNFYTELSCNAHDNAIMICQERIEVVVRTTCCHGYRASAHSLYVSASTYFTVAIMDTG